MKVAKCSKIQRMSRPMCEGFSLVEIMVAVIVVGVLMAIAVPSWAKIRNTAREKETEAALEMLAAAIRQLAWDTGRWPSGNAKTDLNTEVWDLKPSSAGLLGTSSSYTGWKGPYIPDIEEDPWGKDYFFDPDYKISGVNRIVVGSFGPNRQGQNQYDSDDLYIIIE